MARGPRHRSLRVDAALLVALVRVAPAVERPGMTRAHELVADDEALREVVVEVTGRQTFVGSAATIARRSCLTKGLSPSRISARTLSQVFDFSILR